MPPLSYDCIETSPNIETSNQKYLFNPSRKRPLYQLGDENEEDDDLLLIENEHLQSSSPAFRRITTLSSNSNASPFALIESNSVASNSVASNKQTTSNKTPINPPPKRNKTGE